LGGRQEARPLGLKKPQVRSLSATPRRSRIDWGWPGWAPLAPPAPTRAITAGWGGTPPGCEATRPPPAWPDGLLGTGLPVHVSGCAGWWPGCSAWRPRAPCRAV